MQLEGGISGLIGYGLGLTGHGGLENRVLGIGCQLFGLPNKLFAVAFDVHNRWSGKTMLNPAQLVTAMAAALFLAGFSLNCNAQGDVDTKEADIRVIAQSVGINSWAEERVKTRTERFNKFLSVFWQHINESWPDIPGPARPELESAVNAFIAAARSDESPEKILQIWRDSLGEKISAAEAKSLRTFCESQLGRKLFDATGFANNIVSEHLTNLTDRRMNQAFQQLLESSTNIQKKYMANNGGKSKQ